MNENLDQLRQVAERATPGPWAPWLDQDGAEHMNGMLMVGNEAAVIPAGETWVEGVDVNPIACVYTPEDRAHIATFDPPTVLALIDRVEAAEESHRLANVMLRTVLEEMGSGPETDPIIKVRQLVARAGAAEAAVQRVRDAIRDAPTSDPTPPDDWPNDGELIRQGEFLVAEQVRRALDGGEQS